MTFAFGLPTSHRSQIEYVVHGDLSLWSRSDVILVLFASVRTCCCFKQVHEHRHNRVCDAQQHREDDCWRR